MRVNPYLCDCVCVCDELKFYKWKNYVSFLSKSVVDDGLVLATKQLVHKFIKFMSSV